MLRRHSMLAATGMTALAGWCLGACGQDASTPAATTYSVSAGDTSCDVEPHRFAPGEVTLTVENTGSQETEVYVYGKQGTSFTDVVAEAENIGPGTSRELTVTLHPGEYRVTCKPGMVGDGIAVPITVVQAGAG